MSLLQVIKTNQRIKHAKHSFKARVARPI